MQKNKRLGLKQAKQTGAKKITPRIYNAWAMIATSILAGELSGGKHGRGGWVWRISVGLGWATWAQGMNNEGEAGEQLNRILESDEELYYKRREVARRIYRQ